jgi:hypothetical protein
MVGTRIPAGLAFVVVWLMTTLVVAQNPKPPTLTDSPECDDCVTLIYNPADGNLAITIEPTADNRLNVLDIRSNAGLFDPDWCTPPWWDTGDFCEKTPYKIWRIKTSGFGSFEIGSYLPPGLTGEDLAADFIVDGSYLTGGTLDKYNPDSPFLCVVPEPSTAILGLLSFTCLFVLRQHL